MSMHLAYDVFGRELVACEKSDANTMKELSVTITLLVKSSASKKKVRREMMIMRRMGVKVVKHSRTVSSDSSIIMWSMYDTWKEKKQITKLIKVTYSHPQKNCRLREPRDLFFL